LLGEMVRVLYGGWLLEHPIPPRESYLEQGRL